MAELAPAARFWNWKPLALPCCRGRARWVVLPGAYSGGSNNRGLGGSLHQANTLGSKSMLSLLQPLQNVAAAATTILVAVAPERRLTATTFDAVEGLRREVVDARTDPVW